jgi:nucleoside-diphosphate-sugar epimerase
VRILVCGADGFIGGYVVRELARRGHHVTGSVFARAARGSHEIRVDLLRDDLHGHLPARIDVVVNAVGEVKSDASRRQVFGANLGVTERLLAWAARHGARHFAQLSSVAVYGPLVLGEGRGERTLRAGALLGLPYMRSKARAERSIERSGLPYSLLRAPAVVGAGDTVLSTAIARELSGRGLPLFPGARLDHRVSLASAEGLAGLVAEVIARGPLSGALHCGHLEAGLAELAQAYAAALGLPVRYRSLTISEIPALKRDAGLAWWVASAAFGQAYSTDRLAARYPGLAFPSLSEAVRNGVSGLQA